MQTPLPIKTYQRERGFRPTRKEAYESFEIINYYVFGNDLRPPRINFRTLRYWGICVGEREGEASIKLHNQFFSVQWFITILAHEMAHQYQWEIHGPERIRQNQTPIISHGRSFFQFKNKMAKFGIPLRVMYDERKWFRHQDIMRV